MIILKNNGSKNEWGEENPKHRNGKKNTYQNKEIK